ncbi:MAG: protein kinase domain-containing protein, partial [Bythopirellula sp.]
MQLVDSTGRAIQLGHQVGSGGEGNVYDVDGEPGLVAKVYHQMPLTEDQFCKLDLMVARRTPQLSKVAAWPEEILRRGSGNEPCGLLMPKLDKSRQLHELYGTTNRRLRFPDVRWHHLLLAARNLAAAFHTLHEQGIVVGDVNQGNLMVNSKYNIHFIDCDSFQIIDGDKIYYCPVGTPHFTPPELQKQKLTAVARTMDHDGFGLAVLIFHLVFVGRHPFAGRFRGEGDLLIEEAIAERRFAFSRDKEATMVEPPPYSLQLEDLPQALASLFETAFRTGGVNGTPRPTPEQWVEQLDALMSHRAACELDDLHIYYSDLKVCPWCRIEDEGGPAFYV